jgi:hypothetical protein
MAALVRLANQLLDASLHQCFAFYTKMLAAIDRAVRVKAAHDSPKRDKVTG